VPSFETGAFESAFRINERPIMENDSSDTLLNGTGLNFHFFSPPFRLLEKKGDHAPTRIVISV
jgi:hypothetical protein